MKPSLPLTLPAPNARTPSPAARVPGLNAVRQRAFTLIELLVVIAVLAVLAAILFPVLAEGREKGRQTGCLSNKHQLGLAASLYAEDWDEGFPQTHPNGTPWLAARPRRERASLDWFQLLHPYTRTPLVNLCPSDTKISAHRPNSYIPNGYLVYGARLSSVPRPSETIFLYESADNNGDFETRPWYGLDELRNDDVAISRHHGGANYLFCDEHVRWLRFDQTLSPVNMHQP